MAAMHVCKSRRLRRDGSSPLLSPEAGIDAGQAERTDGQTLFYTGHTVSRPLIRGIPPNSAMFPDGVLQQAAADIATT
jgi:hypothetical protein